MKSLAPSFSRWRLEGIVIDSTVHIGRLVRHGRLDLARAHRLVAQTKLLLR